MSREARREIIKSKLVACEIIQRHISVIKATPGTRDDFHNPPMSPEGHDHLSLDNRLALNSDRHKRASSAVASIGLRIMLSLLLVRP
jgi:hypothetical protein